MSQLSTPWTGTLNRENAQAVAELLTELMTDKWITGERFMDIGGESKMHITISDSFKSIDLKPMDDGGVVMTINLKDKSFVVATQFADDTDFDPSMPSVVITDSTAVFVCRAFGQPKTTLILQLEDPNDPKVFE